MTTPPMEMTEMIENTGMGEQSIPSFSNRVGKMNKMEVSSSSSLLKKKLVNDLYSMQKDLTDAFEKDEKFLRSTEGGRESLSLCERNLLLNFFIFDIMLLLIKIGGYMATKSVVLLVTMLESFIQVTFVLVKYFAARIRMRKSKLDFYHFPVGKSRAEPLGIIIFASVMTTLTLKVLKEAVFFLIAYFDSYPPLNYVTTWQDYLEITTACVTFLTRFFVYLIIRFQTWTTVFQETCALQINQLINSFVLIVCASGNSLFIHP
jgi:hypothetical protein